MKFVFFTDPHIKGVNPKARKDNFPETILKKIEEVHSIASNVGAVAELCGGDLYDRADVAESVVIKSNRVLIKSPVNIYSVIGNHDEYGYNPETVERAMIGVTESAGVIKRLSMDNPVLFTEDNLVVGVTGCDSHYELDKLGRIEDY
ncbi:MAG TPA: metallophosphoesterase, partial [Defluviitaleaceae bacterium]|nr:metallophosphoesterase [Defluviitaleaceae bacterium]